MFPHAKPAPRGGTRVPRSQRWMWIAGGITIGVFVLVVRGLAVIYPKVAAHMIRTRADRLAKKLDRTIAIGSIDVSLGHVVVRDIAVKGPLDGDLPLVHVDRVDVDFDTWGSFVGKVELGEAKGDGVIASVRRIADGRDNLRDAIEHYREATADTGTAGGHAPRPTKITVAHARGRANDEQSGATALVGEGDAVWTPTLLVAHGRGITATTTGAPKATISSVEVRRPQGAPPHVKIDGGEIELWPRMALSGIGGEIVADPQRPGMYTLALGGGYGGVPGQLWPAKGELDPKDGAAQVDLEAAKFQLDRLAPILAQSAVVDYQAPTNDTKFHVDVDKEGAKFVGGLELSGLNGGLPYIAVMDVHVRDLSGEFMGSFVR